MEKQDAAENFTFSRKWCVPNVVLNLKAGPLALRNVLFLISDDRLTSEPVIIGRPVLKHMKVDTKSLLEERAALLDGTDCSSVGNPTTGKGGYVSRLMRSLTEEQDQNTARFTTSYNRERLQQDPLPDPALIDLTTYETGTERRKSIEMMLERAKSNGLLKEQNQQVEEMVQ